MTKDNNFATDEISMKYCENVGYNVVLQKSSDGEKCLSSHLCSTGKCENNTVK